MVNNNYITNFELTTCLHEFSEYRSQNFFHQYFSVGKEINLLLVQKRLFFSVLSIWNKLRQILLTPRTVNDVPGKDSLEKTPEGGLQGSEGSFQGIFHLERPLTPLQTHLRGLSKRVSLGHHWRSIAYMIIQIDFSAMFTLKLLIVSRWLYYVPRFIKG